MRTGSAERIVAKQSTAPERLAEFLNYVYPPESRHERFLQQNISRRLEFLISQKLPRKKEKIEAEAIKFHLGALLREVHRADIRPHWFIMSAELGFRPEQRVCEIRGTRWVVGKRSLASTPEQTVYLDIMSSLESGEFSTLRRCGECGSFFVAAHGASTYCRPECQKMHDRNAAPQRMKTKRSRDAAAKRKALKRAAEEQGYKGFCRFWELFNKRRNTRDEGHEMNPILEGLGRGDAARGREVAGQWQRLGPSSQEIWGKLTPSQKKVFL